MKAPCSRCGVPRGPEGGVPADGPELCANCVRGRHAWSGESSASLLCRICGCVRVVHAKRIDGKPGWKCAYLPLGRIADPGKPYRGWLRRAPPCVPAGDPEVPF